jgi:signal transduction histidine kinase
MREFMIRLVLQTLREKALFCLLLSAAIAGNYFSVPLIFGVDFLFGSIAVILVLYLYGTAWGVVTAALATVHTYFFWEHPYAIILFTSEALFLGLARRRIHRNFICLDAAFWLILGAPLVWLCYSVLMDIGITGSLVVLLKQSLNGIYNAAVASLVIFGLPLRRWAKLPEHDGSIPLGQILSSVLASFVLFPAFLFMVVNARQEIAEIEAEVKTRLIASSSDVVRGVVAWQEQYMQAVEQAARIAAKIGIARSRELQHDLEVIQGSFPDFHNIYVADEAGTAVAFYPPVNRYGESTIGKNFADRDYFSKLKASKRPVISDVFMGRAFAFTPIVGFTVPIVENERFRGFALGAVNLEELSALLKHNRTGADLRLTLSDNQGRIVASTDDRRQPLQPVAPQTGVQLTALENSIYHAFPDRRDLPATTRWRQSHYIREMPIGSGIPWTLTAVIPAQPYIDQLQQSYIRILAITLGLSILGLMLSQLLSRLMTEPLSRIAMLTAELPERLNFGGSDSWPKTRVREISHLVSNFKAMAVVLARNFAALASSKNRLEEQARDLTHLNQALRQEVADRKQAEIEVRRNLERIGALNDIGKSVSSTLDLATILKILLRRIDLALPHLVTAVRLYNKAAGFLEGITCCNLDEIEWRRVFNRTPPDHSQTAISLGEPVAIGNVQQDPHERYAGFFQKHGLLSYLGVPLIASGETLGILDFYTREEHRYTADEVEFLSVLAGQAALAIHNSQLYENIKRQANDLDRANRVKSEFLSVMSHELRTPLNVIMGYTGIVQEGMYGRLNEEQRRALDKVKVQSGELLRMVNSILEVTRIEADEMRIESEDVDLPAFLDALKRDYLIPNTNAVTLRWECPNDAPTLNTDPNKLKHVIQNLINNAVKFTERGQVTVSVEPIPEEHKVAFKVSDTGIGMAEEDLCRIFDKFHQVDSSETRSYGGVGLGLYIVKTYTEVLGGEVKVESSLGNGSTFTVTIPENGKERAFVSSPDGGSALLKQPASNLEPAVSGFVDPFRS